MKISISIWLFFFLALQSCRDSLTEATDKWSQDVKGKIIEDSQKDIEKLRVYYKDDEVDSTGKIYKTDTVASIFFSSDKNFELVRELCPGVERNFEGIRFKGKYVGLVELRYCDGKLKERGYRFNGDIGIWQEFDTLGKVIKETDHGNIERLEQLHYIKYYR